DAPDFNSRNSASLCGAYYRDFETPCKSFLQKNLIFLLLDYFSSFTLSFCSIIYDLFANSR
ncbi:hypothetical protein CVP04_03510, partial [Caviibacterium pharyngocola]